MAQLRKVTLLVTMAALSSGQVAFAEEDDDLSLSGLVVTGTRTETPLLDLAGNTATISKKEIDFVDADHVTEVINRLPGVMIQRGNGQEHLTAIRSPVLNGGAGAGSFLYLEDGIPTRAAGFANVNGLFEINTEQAGGIEVVRGPGSALYGSNAVHGLVNVLSRAPSLDLERILDVSVGSHDLYKVKGTVSDTIGSQAYRFSMNGTHDGGWIDDSGFDQQKMTFRHDYFTDTDSFKTLLSASNLNQETAGYEVGHEAYKNRAASKTNEDPNAYRDAQSVRLSTRWDHQLSDNAFFSLTPYVRHTEMEFLMHFIPGTPVEKNAHDSVGLLAAYNRDLEGGHKVIVGTDFEFTRGDLSEVQTGPNVGPKYITGTHYDYDVDATVIAPYVHSEWQVAEKTRVTAGARYEYTRYDYDNKTGDGMFGTLFYRPADRIDEFYDFSPKLGITQRLTEDTSAFLNLARGNRAPQTTDLYRLRLASNENIRAESETMDSVELGVRKVGSGIQYEATSFFMKKRDYFFRDSDNNNVPNGKTRHYGIELSTFVPLGETFDFSGSYTYAVHQYDFDNASNGIVDGNDMDTAPRQMANLRFGWNYMPGTRAELEMIHMGRYYTDEANEHTYEGHDVFNLRASHQISEQLRLYARINNLFDKKYAERADYTSFGGDRYFVGEERTFHVGASYSF